LPACRATTWSTQLKAFKSGTRPATVMHQLSKGYSDAQIEQISQLLCRPEEIKRGVSHATTFIPPVLRRAQPAGPGRLRHHLHPAKAKVVVVGGGYGGATAAKYVRLLSDYKIDVVLIEPNDAFVSCPISNLVLGGSKQMADITTPYSGLGKTTASRS
jgi:hypothetical protein